MNHEEGYIIGWWLRNFEKVSEESRGRIKMAVCCEISDLTDFELSMILTFLKGLRNLKTVPGFEILKEEYERITS